MSNTKCGAKDPSSCRYHGTSTTIAITNAINNGDYEAYANARQAAAAANGEKFDEFFVSKDNAIALAEINDTLENVRFYDKYMTDAGLWSDNEDLEDERFSNETEIELGLEAFNDTYKTLGIDGQVKAYSLLTARDHELLKQYGYDIKHVAPNEPSGRKMTMAEWMATGGTSD